MNIKMNTTMLLVLTCIGYGCKKDVMTKNLAHVVYTFPEEGAKHEGTWLQWPHHYQYGMEFRNRMDSTWIHMTRELVQGENVHIVAYNNTERQRISNLLKSVGVDQTRVDFYIHPTNDFWIRDNGPIYVRDSTGNLIIEDWGFNGWGNKADFEDCNLVPEKIGRDQQRNVLDLNTVMINEGGAVELDGRGSLMACRSSILNNNRNRGMSQTQAEEIFTTYLGATNFIWLQGRKGRDVTDQHIDGFARFANPGTIVTMSENDLLDYDVRQSDIELLYNAKNALGEAYTFVKLPLTQGNVVTTYGKKLGYKGSYCNYYIANECVLVPVYNDPNDEMALSALRDLYPNRRVVGIDCRNVYADGGMIHCITQQQPID
ncbi:MAG: agmatine deiminase family protein [Bacteroidia bacterium]|nr:agmatine deiminase family protein [Bacteroidia bacterium]